MAIALGQIESIIFSTIKIDTRSTGGASEATGFLYEIRREKKFAPFVITNKHVVSGAKDFSFYFKAVSKEVGSNISSLSDCVNYRLDVEASVLKIYEHPDDDVDLVAISFLPLQKYVKENSDFILIDCVVLVSFFRIFFFVQYLLIDIDIPTFNAIG